MRSYAQIPARIKYFIVVFAVPAGEGYSGFDYDSTVRLKTTPAPVQTITEFNTNHFSNPSGYEYPSLTEGELLKDLGQQFIITDANYNHLALYRRVQRVRGGDSEGVSGSPANGWDSFYVRVWEADVLNPASPIAVTRTG
jgi:hypothetical protein